MHTIKPSQTKTCKTKHVRKSFSLYCSALKMRHMADIIKRKQFLKRSRPHA